eukprot:comp22117_c0_seq1/m.51541 comp22117_c0_seq1/g.51541  ORF comp22117_c0_seq1/g.51541 comp22117_c0_seq1/m.51541 type:complete len:643 (-) comp22117_c0_seq1:792-2720(-)
MENKGKIEPGQRNENKQESKNNKRANKVLVDERNHRAFGTAFEQRMQLQQTHIVLEHLVLGLLKPIVDRLDRVQLAHNVRQKPFPARAGLGRILIQNGLALDPPKRPRVRSDVGTQQHQNRRNVVQHPKQPENQRDGKQRARQRRIAPVDHIQHNALNVVVRLNAVDENVDIVGKQHKIKRNPAVQLHILRAAVHKIVPRRPARLLLKHLDLVRRNTRQLHKQRRKRGIGPLATRLFARTTRSRRRSTRRRSIGTGIRCAHSSICVCKRRKQAHVLPNKGAPAFDIALLARNLARRLLELHHARHKRNKLIHAARLVLGPDIHNRRELKLHRRARVVRRTRSSTSGAARNLRCARVGKRQTNNRIRAPVGRRRRHHIDPLDQRNRNPRRQRHRKPIRNMQHMARTHKQPALRRRHSGAVQHPGEPRNQILVRIKLRPLARRIPEFLNRVAHLLELLGKARECRPVDPRSSRSTGLARPRRAHDRIDHRLRMRLVADRRQTAKELDEACARNHIRVLRQQRKAVPRLREDDLRVARERPAGHKLHQRQLVAKRQMELSLHQRHRRVHLGADLVHRVALLFLLHRRRALPQLAHLELVDERLEISRGLTRGRRRRRRRRRSTGCLCSSSRSALTGCLCSSGSSS